MSATNSREVATTVQLLHWTGTLLPAYSAARICYSKVGFDGIKPLESEAAMGEWLRDRVLKRGHWGILEHIHFTFGVSGISRACSHQLVRHRIASYAQQSQRYVDKADFKYITPPSVAENPEALQFYRELMDELGEKYEKLQGILRTANPEANNEKINEDARFIIPNACETQIVVTINGRQLTEISCKRLCSRAQWEIRAMFEQIRTITQATVPVVFDNLGPDCAWGKCKEGGCGRAAMYPKAKGW